VRRPTVAVRDSHVPGYGRQARCPECSGWTGVWESGPRLNMHATERGCICTGSRMAVVLAAAPAAARP
jgi:hypothetical protein